MEEFILNLLCDKIPYEGRTPIYIFELSTELLDLIEEKGMLPPIIKEVIYTPQYDGDNDSFVGGQDDYTPAGYLQWVPEK